MDLTWLIAVKWVAVIAVGNLLAEVVSWFLRSIIKEIYENY